MLLATASRVRAGSAAVIVAFALAAVAGAKADRANFPSKGIVVPGVSIGGIQIGMTEQQVLARWGQGFEVCVTCGPTLTWLYEYKGSEPLGAAIRFDVEAVSTTRYPATGKVIAVFTLGSPLGWGTKGKVMMFDPVRNVYNVLTHPRTVPCIGYAALVVPAGRNSMSIYTTGGVVYGFALTAHSEPPCQ